MKRLLCLVSLLFILLVTLSAQEDTWHVYRPGFSARDICSHDGDVWVASSAGIMRWNPTTNQRIQYDESNTPYPYSWFNCLCFASNGVLWAGGNSGVMSFDGSSWQLFNTANSDLVNNGVYKIVADTHGGVWMGTDRGVSYYRQGVWNSYDSNNSTLPGTYDFYDLALAPAQGLWVATSSGAHYYNGDTWAAYTAQNSTLPNDRVQSISFEGNGDGWFGFYTGVAKYSGGVWQFYSSLDGVAISDVKGSYADPLHRVWLWNQSTLWLCAEDEILHYPAQTFGSNYMYITRMEMDDQQLLWMGFSFQSSPLSLMSFDGTDVNSYPVSELPLASPYIQEIFRGFDDKIWIADSEEKEIGGYLSIGEEGIEVFGKFNTAMPCWHVWALAQDSQLNLWVGTCIGLLKTGPSGSQVFNGIDHGIGGGYMETICPVGDGVWIGNSQGVSRYADGVWTPITNAEAGLNLAYTKVIKADSEGKIWIGCSAGVCCYANSQFTAYPQITYAQDFAFGEDAEVWVARGELSRFHNGEWTHFNASNSGLLQNHAACVAIDQNQVLWVGMGYPSISLYSFDGTNWTHFNAQNSPLTGGIRTIFVDEDNNKWIGGKYLCLYNEAGLPVSNAEQLLPAPISSVNYPNPFKESTTIRYEKRTDGPLQINIYNLKGQKVWTQTGLPAAKGEFLWDGKDQYGQNCATGVYLIQMKDREGSRIHKALKLK
ncbi:MAG: T9SS type A sorting domain-containing protein [Candidatus Cloacimonetes bacterium]|jgi:ligand-binding sensor domain-containing protein|nr:T9SS type A sorting domain-containing protein [Candidatus Cloacimonadota bacterium]